MDLASGCLCFMLAYKLDTSPPYPPQASPQTLSGSLTWIEDLVGEVTRSLPWWRSGAAREIATRQDASKSSKATHFWCAFEQPQKTCCFGKKRDAQPFFLFQFEKIIRFQDRYQIFTLAGGFITLVLRKLWVSGSFEMELWRTILQLPNFQRTRTDSLLLEALGVSQTWELWNPIQIQCIKLCFIQFSDFWKDQRF